MATSDEKCVAAVFVPVGVVEGVYTFEGVGVGVGVSIGQDEYVPSVKVPVGVAGGA